VRCVDLVEALGVTYVGKINNVRGWIAQSVAEKGRTLTEADPVSGGAGSVISAASVF